MLPALPAGIVLDSTSLPVAALAAVLQVHHSERRRTVVMAPLQQARLETIRADDIPREGHQDALAGQRAAHLQGLVASGEEEAAVVAVEEAASRMDLKTADAEGAVLEAMILMPANPVKVEGLEHGVLEVAVVDAGGGGADRIRYLERRGPGVLARDVEAQQGRGPVALAVAGEEVGAGDDAAQARRGGCGVDEGGRRRDAEHDLGEELNREGVDGGGHGAARELRLRRRRHSGIWTRQRRAGEVSWGWGGG